MEKDVNRILFSRKKEWNDAICSNMGGPRDDHIKWNRSDRERQILYDIVYMCTLEKKKIQMNSFPKQRLTDIENEFTITKGKTRVEGRIN